MAPEVYVDSVKATTANASPPDAADVKGDTQRQTVSIHEGLAGVVIARTEITAVNGERGALSYRGYDVGELAAHSTFEETVYLLWHKELPTRDALDEFTKSLAAERDIDETTWDILTILPKNIEPMDALRTTVSALSCSDADDGDGCPRTDLGKARRLLATFPTIVANTYRHQHGLARVHPNPDLTHAANFLYMINDAVPTKLQASSMDMTMLLMVDHGLNASTFAARVTAATLSDMYSAITTALGTLKGPLHGGANVRAMQMMLEIEDIDNVEPYITDALARKQRIMGFGHRVYRRVPDPRSAYLRGRLHALCAELGDFHYYELATAIAETIVAKIGLYPNVDFYTAPVLYLLGIPLELFVPVFAISRICGWTTQVMEQYANNRLIRPSAEYVGPKDLTYRPIEER